MYTLSLETLAGAGGLGLPAILVAIFLLWRATRIVFWLAMALLVVGFGYLAATGALEDVGRGILNRLPAAATTPA